MAIKKIIILLLASAFFITIGFAQTSNAAKLILKIKQNTNCLYAEATMKDKEEALNAAKAILEIKVSDWIRSQGADNVEVCIAKAKDQCFEIQTMRGNYHRAFVYVNKMDILPVTDKKEVVVFQVDNASAIPSNESSAMVVSEDAPIPQTAMLTTEEENMKGITKFYDIQPYIESLKESRRLDTYGKYSTMPENGNCHIFVYDKQGKIVAVLRKTSDYTLNLHTLKSDNIKNYKNCGAIWFRLK